MEDRRRDQRVTTARHAATTGRDTDDPVYAANIAFDVKATTLGALVSLVLLIYASVTDVTMPLAVPLILALTAAALAYLLLRTSLRRRGHERLNAARADDEQAQPPEPTPLDRALAGKDGDLIGDDARNAVIDLLSERYAGGYLDQAMLHERQTIALHARRRGDLIPALLDLPL